MDNELAYTIFNLGSAQLHQLHTGELVAEGAPNGKFFVMAEVAQQLFQETPQAFAKDLRAGHYAKVVSHAPEVLATVQVCLLPPTPIRWRTQEPTFEQGTDRVWKKE